MGALKNMKNGDKVYGIIYGKGGITNTFKDSFYAIEVTYDTGDVIYYTIDGVPGWGLKIGLQTVFAAEDIDLMDYDVSPSSKTMSIKKIIKCVMDKTLEIKCPSGIWCSIEDAPEALLEKYIFAGNLHLFRRNKKNKEK